MKPIDVAFATVNQQKRLVLESALKLIIKTEEKIKRLKTHPNMNALSEDEVRYLTRQNYAQIYSLETALQEFKEWVRNGNRPRGSTQIFEKVSELEKLMLTRGTNPFDVECELNSSLRKTTANAIYYILDEKKRYKFTVPPSSNEAVDLLYTRHNAYLATVAVSPSFRWVVLVIEAVAILPLIVVNAVFLSLNCMLVSVIFLALLQILIGITISVSEDYPEILTYDPVDFSLEDEENADGVMPWTKINQVLNANCIDDAVKQNITIGIKKAIDAQRIEKNNEFIWELAVFCKNDLYSDARQTNVTLQQIFELHQAIAKDNPHYQEACTALVELCMVISREGLSESDSAKLRRQVALYAAHGSDSRLANRLFLEEAGFPFGESSDIDVTAPRDEFLGQMMNLLKDMNATRTMTVSSNSNSFYQPANSVQNASSSIGAPDESDNIDSPLKVSTV